MCFPSEKCSFRWGRSGSERWTLRQWHHTQLCLISLTAVTWCLPIKTSPSLCPGWLPVTVGLSCVCADGLCGLYLEFDLWKKKKKKILSFLCVTNRTNRERVPSAESWSQNNRKWGTESNNSFRIGGGCIYKQTLTYTRLLIMNVYVWPWPQHRSVAEDVLACYVTTTQVTSSFWQMQWISEESQLSDSSFNSLSVFDSFGTLLSPLKTLRLFSCFVKNPCF